MLVYINRKSPVVLMKIAAIVGDDELHLALNKSIKGKQTAVPCANHKPTANCR